MDTYVDMADCSTFACDSLKAKELLNQTDVDFRCFSELWEKAHQHVR